VTDEERKVVIAGMKTLYAGFVEAVAKNRSMPKDRVEELAQGRVWSGVVARTFAPTSGGDARS
jgi:protease-4